MTGDSEPISDETLAEIERRAKVGLVTINTTLNLVAEVVRLRASLDRIEDEAAPTPEQVAHLAAASPSVTPLLVEIVQHAIKQADAALADSRIDADSPAAAWLRTIRATLTDGASDEPRLTDDERDVLAEANYRYYRSVIQQITDVATGNGNRLRSAIEEAARLRAEVERLRASLTAAAQMIRDAAPDVTDEVDWMYVCGMFNAATLLDHQPIEPPPCPSGAAGGSGVTP